MYRLPSEHGLSGLPSQPCAADRRPATALCTARNQTAPGVPGMKLRAVNGRADADSTRLLSTVNTQAPIQGCNAKRPPRANEARGVGPGINRVTFILEPGRAV